MEYVETVVIGAGQAGLAMSYHLARLRREHVVFERRRIAERWRTERWDSLVFQFPNWMLRLPGFAYAGDEPDSFMPRDGVVRFLEDYARHIAPPVRCGVRVTALRAAAGGRWRIQTDGFGIEALNVVVATGPYQQPLVPPFSTGLPLSVFQTTANCYINAAQLPPGKVLVVGAGGSGWQIAEDLLQGGRDVYLSVGRHRRVPRRYRGKDFGWWQEATGAADRITGGVAGASQAPLLTGVNGGHDADLRDLARRGATLLGSLGGVHDGHLRLVGDLDQNLAQGDATFERFMRSVDEFVAGNALGVAPPLPDARREGAERPVRLPPADLDMRRAGISAVVWAMGYRADYRWIEGVKLAQDGGPVHHRGVTATPGLYFLGLPRMHKVKSAFLWGVGEDAAYLAEQIARRT